MKRAKNKHISLLLASIISLIMSAQKSWGQSTTRINWLSWEQLSDSLQMKPKKVFINFYANWCINCLKLEQLALADTQVVSILFTQYYSVKMNVETEDTIVFGNQTYVNENLNKKASIHQIALLMASRRGKPFSLPAMVLLDESFEATARYFQYMDAEQLLLILKKNI